MDPAQLLRHARIGAGFTQRELASLAGTSQATISAYESGSKRPSVATLNRLLSATGAQLSTEPAPRPKSRSEQDFEQANRTLIAVLGLAAALPTEYQRELRYPRLHTLKEVSDET